MIKNGAFSTSHFKLALPRDNKLSPHLFFAMLQNYLSLKVTCYHKLNDLRLECGTWFHHLRSQQCVLSRNLRIFNVATWHYRCRHHPKIILKDDDYDICIYWRDIAFATCSRSQPLLNMNIEGNFKAILWRHRWRHHHEKYFWHSLGRSFHIWGKITGCDIGSWIYQQDNHEYFRYFELFIDALAQIWTYIYIYIYWDIYLLKIWLCDLVTSSITSWLCET